MSAACAAKDDDDGAAAEFDPLSPAAGAPLSARAGHTAAVLSPAESATAAANKRMLRCFFIVCVPQRLKPR
jgi:hypothetical protein